METSHKDVEFIRDTLFKKAKTKQFNIKQFDKFKKIRNKKKNDTTRADALIVITGHRNLIRFSPNVHRDYIISNMFVNPL